MSPTRYTPEQRAEAIELYRTDGPTKAEKQLGIPKGTVTRWAKETGVETVSVSITRAATEAAAVNAKSRRQSIIDRMYTRAEFLLKRVEADTFQALVPSSPGVQSPRLLDFVPAAEERQLAASMTSYLGAAEKLEKVDADNGVQAAESMLGKLVEGIGVPDE